MLQLQIRDTIFTNTSDKNAFQQLNWKRTTQKTCANSIFISHVTRLRCYKKPSPEIKLKYPLLYFFVVQ